MTSIAIKDNDKLYRSVVKEIEATKHSFVTIGFQKTGEKKKDRDKKDTDLTVAEVAAINEFGTDKIPARPFLRTTFDEQKDRVYRLIGNFYNKILEGKETTKKALDTVGVFMTGEVKKTIDKTVSPPLAASTIAAKGSSKPLIDTGQMRQSVNFKTTITNQPIKNENV